MAIRVTPSAGYGPIASDAKRTALFGKLKASFRGEQPSAQAGGMSGQGNLLGSGASFEDRKAQYEKDLGEYNLGKNKAQLAKLKAEDEEIASGKFMLNGQAVSRNEYEKDREQSSENNSASMVGSLRSFQEDPSKFFMGGGQDLGELTNYLGQANQLFRATGQEGNLMDFILGSTPSKQDQMRQFNLRTFQRAAPGIDFPSIGGSQASVMGFPSGQSLANRQSQPTPLNPEAKQNSEESTSERLSRSGIRPEEQAQIIGALGPSGRGTYVAKEFSPR